MFEAIASICIETGGETICRYALLPGFAADTEAGCLAALHEGEVELSGQTGPPSCVRRRASRLLFTEIAPGVFAHRGAIEEPGPGNLGDVSNIGFVIGENAIAVIDAGGSRAVGEEVYLAIRERSDLPILAVILTHMHPDHVFGAGPLAESGAEVIGRAGLSRALAERSGNYSEGFTGLIGPEGFLGTRVVSPDREVKAEEMLDLGNRTLHLVARPTAHTATDLTVADLASGVVFAGDLVFAEHAPALDGSLKGWQATLAAIREEPAALLVPGHGGPTLPWPEGGAALSAYLAALEEDTRNAIEAGVPLSTAAATIGRGEAANWSLFDLYNARNATVAYTELEWE
ncbi:quinoprotein relay system zinc metallohydrolase 2 [Albidovulum aquaemixtae]|nr:quinoprotein relay system zinc metallohydrolase 2 [Defluviimonas aquaemixtae]